MPGVIAIPLIILGFLAAAVALAALIFLFAKLFGLTWRVLTNIFRFIGAELTDTLRFVGAVLSALLFAPLVVLNIVIGRWSASRHFAGAFWGELKSGGRCVYRVCVGNPARLFGLGSALEGVEQRVPQAMAAAPGRDKPGRRVGQFDGYTIVGSLQTGGSGSKLYIAQPDDIKRAGFARNGLHDVDRVVIKVFSLKDGSSLPQIVRESRALDAAKKLGLVLEHELTPERFYYVMRYVPGDSLATVTQRLHSESPTEGLDNRRLATALGYACDLLVSLDAYHRAGLWHKDVKPDNIIVDGSDGRAHLVDFGLVTPLRSAMTLTTHGTEYFRDPELVRQALRGVKVHEIDGSRFDLYAAGAVLYSVIENSFPAHGGLSQLTRRCPEALRWVVRRAMTDYDRRYASAGEMLADLRVVQAAADPFKLKPVDLPSVSGKGPVFEPDPIPEPFEGGPVAQGAAQAQASRSPVVPPVPPAAPAPGGRPKLTVSDWWSGRYSVVGASVARNASTPTEAFAPRPPVPPVPLRPQVPPASRRPAHEQVRDARSRVRQRRLAAHERIASRRAARGRPTYSNSPGAATAFAGVLGVVVLVGLVGIVGSMISRGAHRGVAAWAPDAPTPPEPASAVGVVGRVGVSADGVYATVAVPADLPEVAARVLVVSDLGLPMDPAVRDRVDRGLSVLRDAGVSLSGDLVDTSDASVDTLASVRRERGSVPADSDELPMRLRSWLKSHDTEGVLLLAADPEDDGRINALLVTQPFFTRMGWSASAPEQFVRVLAGNGFVPRD